MITKLDQSTLETDAFEQWAASEKMEMSLHPLHYLFLNGETDAARQGWKAALKYAEKQNVVLIGAAVKALTLLKELESGVGFEDHEYEVFEEFRNVLMERCYVDPTGN